MAPMIALSTGKGVNKGCSLWFGGSMSQSIADAIWTGNLCDNLAKSVPLKQSPVAKRIVSRPV